MALFEITGAGAGKALNYMNHSNFSAAARKEAIRQLKHNGTMYHQAMTKHWQKERALTQILLDEHARLAVGNQLMDELVVVEEQLDSLKSRVSEKGFDIDDDRISLSRFAPDGLDDIIQQEVERRIGTSSSIHERFDNARMAMLTVQNFDDADKVMKSIRELIN
jgi:hypothetical protein